MVLLNNVFYDTGLNAQEYHNEVGNWYQVPHVSVRDTIYQRMKAGEYIREELTPDGLHPNDKGHGLVAGEITKFLERIMDDLIQDENLTDEQSTRYKKLLEKQYSNLSYDIKNEKIDGDNAVISTEIKVINYKKAINDTYNYYQGRDDYTVEEYNNTKLKNLEKEKEKVTYTIDFDVKKDKDGNWKIASLSNETIKKIQGMY